MEILEPSYSVVEASISYDTDEEIKRKIEKKIRSLSTS
jgi:hypothetical protein